LSKTFILRTGKVQRPDNVIQVFERPDGTTFDDTGNNFTIWRPKTCPCELVIGKKFKLKEIWKKCPIHKTLDGAVLLKAVRILNIDEREGLTNLEKTQLKARLGLM